MLLERLKPSFKTISAAIVAVVVLLSQQGLAANSNSSTAPAFQIMGLFNEKPTQFCDLVSVNSFMIQNGKTYYQEGIGWSVRSPKNKLQIIAPSHVVHGAEVLIGQCGDARFPLAIRAESPSRDFAVLDIKYPTHEETLKASGIIRPLIDFNEPSQGGPVYTDHTRFMNKNWLKNDKQFLWSFVTTSGPRFERQRKVETSSPATMAFSLPTAFASTKKSGSYGINDLLILETFAIRPGLSGAPLLVSDTNITGKPYYAPTKGPTWSKPAAPIKENSGHFLVGMLIRTDIAGSRAMAISIDDIIRNYNEIADLSDQSIQALDLLSAPLVKYETGIPGKSLQRVPTLIQPLSDGTQFKAQEVCHDNDKESSTWYDFAAQLKQEAYFNTEKLNPGEPDFTTYNDLLKSFEKEKNRSGITPSIPFHTSDELKRSFLLAGGDYAEGGGGDPLSEFSTFKKVNLMQHPDEGWSDSLNHPSYVYRSEHLCRVAGLSTNKKGILIGYVDESGIGHKVSDINDLNYQLKNISSKEREEKINLIFSQGQFIQNDKLNYKPLCQMEYLKNKPFLAFKGLSSGIFYGGGDILYVKQIANTTDHLSKNFIRCSEDNNRFDFSLDQTDLVFPLATTTRSDIVQNSPPKMKIRFSINSNKEIRGQVQIGSRCMIELNTKNVIPANIWKYQIRDKNFKADVNLDSKDRLIRVKIFEIGESCATWSNRPWLEDIMVVK